MTVQRYDMENLCGGEYPCGMVPNKRGDYVEYDDYESQEATVVELEQEIEMLRGKIDDAEEEYTRLEEENAELRQTINRFGENRE